MDEFTSKLLAGEIKELPRPTSFNGRQDIEALLDLNFPNLGGRGWAQVYAEAIKLCGDDVEELERLSEWGRANYRFFDGE